MTTQTQQSQADAHFPGCLQPSDMAMNTARKALEWALAMLGGADDEATARATEEITDFALETEQTPRKAVLSSIMTALALIEEDGPRTWAFEVDLGWLTEMLEGADIGYWGEIIPQEPGHWMVHEHGDDAKVNTYYLDLDGVRLGIRHMMADVPRRSRVADGRDFAHRILDQAMRGSTDSMGGLGDVMIQYAVFGGQRYA